MKPDAKAININKETINKDILFWLMLNILIRDEIIGKETTAEGLIIKLSKGITAEMVKTSEAALTNINANNIFK